LIIAARKGLTECVDELIKKGGDIHFETVNGTTALLGIKKYCIFFFIIQLLLQKGNIK